MTKLFVRLAPSRNRDIGSVSLYVVGQFAERHGGRIELRNRPQGGLSALLVVPRA